MNFSNFEIIPGSPNSKVILHVPHSAREIPEEVRSEILLNDLELEFELDEMTDADTDKLTFRGSAAAQLTPWVFINRLSRLVVDPERFPDNREIMNSVGMGAIYTKTSSGTQLRLQNLERDNQLLDKYFHPYALAFTDLVVGRLDAVKNVTIIDIHSYRLKEHLNGVNKGQRRPPICVGTDSFHTPQWLIDSAIAAFTSAGEVILNEPYAGTYVPMRFYEKERNVNSVMMENREDTIAGEGMERSARALAVLIDAIEVRGVQSE